MRHAAPEIELPPVPVESVISVDSDRGPSEVTCKACGLLMLPMREHVTLRGHMGLAEWVCLPCYRGVHVTWGRMG